MTLNTQQKHKFIKKINSHVDFSTKVSNLVQSMKQAKLLLNQIKQFHSQDLPNLLAFDKQSNRHTISKPQILHTIPRAFHQRCHSPKIVFRPQVKYDIKLCQAAGPTPIILNLITQQNSKVIYTLNGTQPQVMGFDPQSGRLIFNGNFGNETMSFNQDVDFRVLAYRQGLMASEVVRVKIKTTDKQKVQPGLNLMQPQHQLQRSIDQESQAIWDYMDYEESHYNVQ